MANKINKSNIGSGGYYFGTAILSSICGSAMISLGSYDENEIRTYDGNRIIEEDEDELD